MYLIVNVLTAEVMKGHLMRFVYACNRRSKYRQDTWHDIAFAIKADETLIKTSRVNG